MLGFQPAQRDRLRVVIGGHVDHGKSTIIGRLLADTGSLPLGKLDQVKAACERTGRVFEYAFLLDALKDEQSQGITIDSARAFFKTAARDYLIIDAPGHIEFLKNMVTGAARAEAALLVIDAAEGVRENSRRHAYLMSMLGIRNIAVLVNKMDLVDHDRCTFDRISRDYREFLRRLDIEPTFVIPVAGRDGENLASRSEALSWYDGPILLDALEAFPTEQPAVDKAFRMPVQDVYKFTARGDDRRIVAGRIESGMARVGERVVFYPSGKAAVIKSFEAFNQDRPLEASAGESVGFTLQDQIYVTRGEVATIANEPRPYVTTRLRVNLFWLGKQPLAIGKTYALKLGTTRVLAEVEQIIRTINASDLSGVESPREVQCHEGAEAVVRCDRAIAVDLIDDLPATGRFVLVEDYSIRGGGIVREALPDDQSWVRERVLLRNCKWEPSGIPGERRAARFAQQPTLVLVSSADDVDRKGLAKALERRLFDMGNTVYFLGIGNVLYGVDADLARSAENRAEHMRRLGEVGNLMLDAGMILIVTAAELTERDIEVVRTSVDPRRIEVIWRGEHTPAHLDCDLWLPADMHENEAVERVVQLLQEKGIVFRAQ